MSSAEDSWYLVQGCEDERVFMASEQNKMKSSHTEAGAFLIIGHASAGGKIFCPGL